MNDPLLFIHVMTLFVAPPATLAQPQLQLAITDRLQAVATLSTNAVVAIGERAGLSSSLVLRIDDDGTVPWAFSLGDDVLLQDIHVTNTDDLIVVGRLTDSVTNEVHPLVAMFDAGGTVQWARWMDLGSPDVSVVNSSYRSGSIHLTAITTGPYLSKALMRVFTSGQLSWAVAPGATFPTYDFVRRLANNDVIYAHRLTPTGDLMRVDGSGNVVWAKHLEVDGSGNNAVQDAASLSNGNTLVAFRNTGAAGNTLFTVELDAAGSVIPGTERGYSIDTAGGAWGCTMVLDGDDERTFSCRTNGITRTVMQTDAGGAVQWVLRAATTPAGGGGLARYSDDHLVVVNSDGGNWNYVEATADVAPALLCMTGDAVPTTLHSCTTTDIPETLAPVVCVPNTYVPVITPITITTGTVCGTVGSTGPVHMEEWRVHPVPAVDVLWVDGPVGDATISMLEIIDAAGHQWSRQVNYDLRRGVEVTHLPPGAYVLRLHARDRIHGLRFLR